MGRSFVVLDWVSCAVASADFARGAVGSALADDEGPEWSEVSCKKEAGPIDAAAAAAAESPQDHFQNQPSLGLLGVEWSGDGHGEGVDQSRIGGRLRQDQDRRQFQNQGHWQCLENLAKHTNNNKAAVMKERKQ